MRSKDKWLKDYPMIDYEKADCKRIRNSVGEKLSEQKGEVIYMKKRSFKPLAIIGAVLAVSLRISIHSKCRYRRRCCE